MISWFLPNVFPTLGGVLDRTVTDRARCRNNEFKFLNIAAPQHDSNFKELNGSVCRSVISLPCDARDSVENLPIFNLIALFGHPYEHINRSARPECAGHRGHAACADIFGDLFRKEHNRRGEQNVPIFGPLFLSGFPVETVARRYPVQIELHNKVILVDIGGDVRARENLLMHLGNRRIHAAKEQREARALRIGFVEIFGLECIRHPVGLVQAITAQFRLRQAGQQQSCRDAISRPRLGSPGWQDAPRCSKRKASSIHCAI